MGVLANFSMLQLMYIYLWINNCLDKQRVGKKMLLILFVSFVSKDFILKLLKYKTFSKNWREKSA